MVLPISLLLCLVVSILPSPSLAAAAEGGPSCLLSNLPSLSNSYDLSPLSELQLIEDTKKTPPTETTSRVRFKLCGEGDGIGKEEGVDEEDQCPPNTFACLQIQNTSPKSTPPLRTLEVIPIAGNNIPSIDLPLDTTWSETSVTCSEGTPKKEKCFDLVGTMKGGMYNGEPQSLAITLVCSSDPTSSSPTFTSYVDNVLSLRWESPDACPRSGDGTSPPPPSNGGKGGGGMGFFGWLFLLLLFGPPIYLGLGIYHNRTTYDARGWDMLPHREFWRDFPSLVHDLASHLIGGVTGSRRSSGGAGGGGSGSTGRGGYESL
ncbi:autophagy-related protein 27 [Mrakia frigida]|uniref:autophagy-related protein 27 n=1 Tax=Mrakia frigida TaxID=29902 RepID=UPI003FCC1C58